MPRGTTTFNLTAGTVSSGTGTITSVGNGWYRLAVNMTNTGSGDPNIYWDTFGSGALIWGAQAELGSTATAYQRVVSSFDVTEAGVPSLHYLSFDGVDDFMVTPTITPGIDKVQVFAGVRKLSDAADGTILHHGDPSASENGSFRLDSPGSGAVTKYQFASRGTVTAIPFTTNAAFNAPVTNVVTNIGDIAGDNATLRINGSQIAQVVTDQGTGNYLAYPLYIGRRGGTSLPFNGHLYSLIVRFGANLDANSIANTETWVNGRTGAY
jgi:hypothetical protein